MSDDIERSRNDELRAYEITEPLLGAVAIVAIAIVAWLLWGAF